MSDIRIFKESTARGPGRYVAHLDGVEGEAELTFTPRPDAVISADHVRVPEPMSRRDLGSDVNDLFTTDTSA